MNPMNPQEFANWLKTLLEETFAKPAGQPGYMLDRSATGLLGTLETLSAEQVSLAENSTSIAAQCGHVAFIQAAFIRWMAGEEYEPDWSQSWLVREVDSAQWDELRKQIRDQHAELINLLETRPLQDPLENAALLITHSAYHLGAIRQIARGQNLI